MARSKTVSGEPRSATALAEGQSALPGTDATALVYNSNTLFMRADYLAQSAWVEHIPFAFWLIGAHRPARVVELGTHHGTSYFAFCQAVAALGLEADCAAIDTWKGDKHAGRYGEEVYRAVSDYNGSRYSAFSTLIRSTFDKALDYFEDGSIDLLHIDGLHTYEAAKWDFETWLPKMSRRGIVLLHDTAMRERGFGVVRLWAELEQRYPTFHFTHGHGLGVVAVGPDQNDLIARLTSAAPDSGAETGGHQMIHRTFALLGRGYYETLERRKLQEHATDLGAELAEARKTAKRTIKTLEARLAKKTRRLASAEARAQAHELAARLATARLEDARLEDARLEHPRLEHSGAADAGSDIARPDSPGLADLPAADLGHEVAAAPTLTADAANHAAELAARDTALERRDAEIAALSLRIIEAIKDKDAAVNPLRKALAEKDREIAEVTRLRDKSVGKSREELNTTRIVLEETQKTLELAQTELAQARSDTDALKTALAKARGDTDALKAALDQARGDQSQADAHLAMIAAKDKQIAAKDKQIADTERLREKSVTKARAEQGQAVADLKRALAARDKALAELERARGTHAEQANALAKYRAHAGRLDKTLRALGAVLSDGKARGRLSRGGVLADRLVEAVRQAGTIDSDWYLAQYSDVRDAGHDPVRHFILQGISEGRQAAPGYPDE